VVVASTDAMRAAMVVSGVTSHEAVVVRVMQTLRGAVKEEEEWGYRRC
jgi:hypothetical protein